MTHWNTCRVMQWNICMYKPTTKRATFVLYVYVEGGHHSWKSPSVHGTTQCRVHISAERPIFPPKRALYSCQRALYLHLQFHRLWGIVHCPIPPVCTNIKNQCKFIWNIALNCGHIGLFRRNMRIFGVFETTHIVPYHLCVNISLDMKREIYKYRRHIVPVYTHEYTRMHISTSTRTRTSTRQAHVHVHVHDTATDTDMDTDWHRHRHRHMHRHRYKHKSTQGTGDGTGTGAHEHTHTYIRTAPHQLCTYPNWYITEATSNCRKIGPVWAN